MESYTKKFWGLIQSKLGSVVGLLEPVAKQVKLALAAGDAEGLVARGVELEELGQQLILFGQKMQAAAADGNIDLAEGADLLVGLEDVVDEAEDVITGVDEDDPVDPPVE